MIVALLLPFPNPHIDGYLPLVWVLIQGVSRADPWFWLFALGLMVVYVVVARSVIALVGFIWRRSRGIGSAVLAATSLAAMAGAASAQDVGIGAGTTYAKLDIFRGASTRTRADPTFGVVYHVPLFSGLAVEPELWYTTKGSLQKATTPGPPCDISRHQ